MHERRYVALDGMLNVSELVELATCDTRTRTSDQASATTNAPTSIARALTSHATLMTLSSALMELDSLKPLAEPRDTPQSTAGATSSVTTTTMTTATAAAASPPKRRRRRTISADASMTTSLSAQLSESVPGGDASSSSTSIASVREPLQSSDPARAERLEHPLMVGVENVSNDDDQEMFHVDTDVDIGVDDDDDDDDDDDAYTLPSGTGATSDSATSSLSTNTAKEHWRPVILIIPVNGIRLRACRRLTCALIDRHDLAWRH
jgi:hypothetical protein